MGYSLIETGVEGQSISKIEIVFLSFDWFDDLNSILVVLDSFLFSVQVK
jgi:hypothetical protein